MFFLMMLDDMTQVPPVSHMLFEAPEDQSLPTTADSAGS